MAVTWGDDFDVIDMKEAGRAFCVTSFCIPLGIPISSSLTRSLSPIFNAINLAVIKLHFLPLTL